MLKKNEVYIFNQFHNFLYVTVNSCVDLMICSDMSLFGSYDLAKQCF